MLNYSLLINLVGIIFFTVLQARSEPVVVHIIIQLKSELNAYLKVWNYNTLCHKLCAHLFEQVIDGRYRHCSKYCGHIFEESNAKRL